MRSLRSSSMAMIVVVAFLTTIVFGPTLTSCGGGGSDGGSSDGTADSFAAFQSSTTDSTGKATFTPTKLKDTSGNAITSFEVTLTLPNGNAAAGLTVYFAESDDSHFMVVGRDANGAYQTVFMGGNSQEITPSASVVLRGVSLESGAAVPAMAGLDSVDKDFGIVSLTIVAFVALVGTIELISIQNTFRKAAGKIDPVRLAKTGTDCFSFATLMDHYDIASDSVGLLFWAASTLSTAGAAAATDALYEVVLDKITDDIKDEVADAFWDEVAASALAAFNITKDTNLCWVLRAPSLDYSKIFEVRPDRTCTTAADCDTLTAVAQDFTKIDGDQDGVTPAAGDCNDENATIFPDALEVCDSGVDSNCDGATTACNITTNSFMDSWPTVAALSDNGSGDVSLVHFYGSFVGTGNDTITEARIIVNNNAEQRVGTENYGGGQFGWDTYVGLTRGANRIQVVGQGGSHYGSKIWNFTNTTATDKLTIMLTWDACPGLRLYVTEPGSAVVSYGNRTGAYGSMTFAPDATTGWGPEIYEAANPAASQTYSFYAKYGDNGSCGASGTSTNFTMRIFTPYGDQVKTGTLSTLNETSGIYEVSF